MLKKLILFAAILSLSACAFDKDSSRVNAKETAEREKLLMMYTPVKGVYRGTVTTDSSQQPVELHLFTLENEAGKNANGEDRYLISLRGNYKKLSSVEPDQNFKARYVPETGKLILTTVKALLETDDVHTINAEISNQKITGEAITISGEIGRLELTLVSSASSKPGSSESDFNERLRRQYQAVAGTYSGDNILNGKVTFKMQIVLRVVEKDMGGSKTRPQLVGEFSRSDDSGEFNMVLTSFYQPDLSPPKLVLTGRLFIGNPNNNAYEATFEGVVIDGNYHGSWSSNARGFQGDFILKKVK